jgi:hypothetical protein
MPVTPLSLWFSNALTKSTGRRAACAIVAPVLRRSWGVNSASPSVSATIRLTTQRMTGKRRHAFELAGEHRSIVRIGFFVPVGFERFADQSHRAVRLLFLTIIFWRLPRRRGTLQKFPRGFPGTKPVRSTFR